jgi:hypothetical protein
VEKLYYITKSITILPKFFLLCVDMHIEAFCLTKMMEVASFLNVVFVYCSLHKLIKNTPPYCLLSPILLSKPGL